MASVSVPSEHPPERRVLVAVRPAHALAACYLVVVAGLVLLRALIDGDVAFLGMGWILALAAVPLLPWLVPALMPWLDRVAPYVGSVKLGSLEFQLRQPEATPTVADVGTTLADPSIKPLHVAGQEDFTTTHALAVIAAIKSLHDRGVEVVTVDLGAGSTWRYPNLYFLTRLLVADPLVRAMAFTESRGGEGGFFVAMCDPGDLIRRFEAALPPYQDAGKSLTIPADLSLPGTEQQLKSQFDAFRDVLAQSQGRFAELEAWVTSQGLLDLLGTAANRAAVEAKDELADDDYRTILLSPFRYVAMTSAGRFRSVVDQTPLAVAFARAVVASR